MSFAVKQRLCRVPLDSGAIAYFLFPDLDKGPQQDLVISTTQIIKQAVAAQLVHKRPGLHFSAGHSEGRRTHGRLGRRRATGGRQRPHQGVLALCC